MNWNKDKSILLSQICIILFAVFLAFLDIEGRLAVKEFYNYRGFANDKGNHMLITLYFCSVFGWIALFHMWKLLANMKRAEVFTESNVKYMRIISWCCFIVSIACVISAFRWYLPFLVVAVAAAFVGLIIRIVKNVFQQANSMKSELDLTI